MKFRISVSEDNFESVKEFLSGRGIEISDDAEYIITEAPGHTDFIPVRNEKKERVRLKTDEIIYIEAFGKDIEIHTDEGTFSSQDRMYQLESQLDPKEFIRVSKSVIISRKHVKKIRPTFSMKYILTMTNGELVDVTRSYYTNFRNFFNI
ncbi:MAG: LytTR family transcriptional regulator [Lachnospiraceae bacterium]|nr:LytTR family transcriptional regulator [Lachnospiraceae bacterium]